MTTPAKKSAILLGAAVALSSGAYALGSQAGDGGAIASGSNAAAGAPASAGAATAFVHGGSGTGAGPGRRAFRRDFGLDRPASRLGVSETALRNALEDLRDDKTFDQRRAEVAQRLATALGKPVDDVTKALDSTLPQPRRDHVGSDLTDALAKALGIDAAKVRAALDKLRDHVRAHGPDRNGDPRTAFADALAGELGVDAAKVRSALDAVGPRFHHRHDGRGGPGDVPAKLASALGVTTAQLRAAFEKVRTQERDAFATALAQKLGIAAQKVKDAIGDGPFLPFGERHRHG